MSGDVERIQPDASAEVVMGQMLEDEKVLVEAARVLERREVRLAQLQARLTLLKQAAEIVIDEE